MMQRTAGAEAAVTTQQKLLAKMFLNLLNLIKLK